MPAGGRQSDAVVEYAFSQTGERMSIRFVPLLCAFVFAIACRSSDASVDAIAERYVRAALALSQHDRSLVDDWRGPEAWNPGPRRPVAELLPEIELLERQIDMAASDISSGLEYARVHYLAGQIQGLRFALDRQLGRAASIDDQAMAEFNVTFPPLDRAEIDRVHAKLRLALPGDGTLDHGLATLRRATAVPRERRLVVLTKAVEACRQAAAPVVPMPRDETINLVFRSGLPWDAFARYEGHHRTEIEFNDDGELDISRAARLACHEAYPGHHLQHLLIDRLFGERQWPELLLSPGFGPHLLFTEGAAEVGADLALPPAARARLYREQLFPAAEADPAYVDRLVAVEDLLIDLLPVVTDVARQYLASAITQQQALDRLRTEALIANPPAALAFIERRRARALVYGEGRRVVYGHLRSRDLGALFDAFRRAAALQ
jgi:hypothetical protein